MTTGSGLTRGLDLSTMRGPSGGLDLSSSTEAASSLLSNAPGGGGGGGGGGGPVYAMEATSSDGHARAPDYAAADITGDIDIRVDVFLSAWTSSNARPFNKYAASSPYSWELVLGRSDGSPLLTWTTNGSSRTFVTTAAPGFTDGTRQQVRVTLDVDNGAGGYEVRFYKRDPALDLALTDNTSWTQFGSTVTGGATTSIYAGTNPIVVNGLFDGTNQTSGVAGMIVYGALAMDGINGTVAIRFDPSDAPLGSTGADNDTWNDSDTDAVWTLYGNSEIIDPDA